MKILWIGPSMFVKSGYGKITYNVCTRLRDKGFDIVTVGGQHVLSPVTINGILCLPKYKDNYFSDVLDYYVKKYNIDVMINIYDFWVMKHIQYVGIPYINYLCNIDAKLNIHSIDEYYSMLYMSDMLWSCSHFAVNELNGVGLKSHYVPLGVNTDIYKPDIEYRKRGRRMFNIPDDSFVFCFVGANISERKDIPSLIDVFSRFVNEVDKKSYLLLWTNIDMVPGECYDIKLLCKIYGVDKNVIVPYFNPMIEPITERDMSIIYNVSDVFVTASRGEGFCIPILESQSCGVPVIAHNCSAMTELVKGHGWLVDSSGYSIPLWTKLHLEYPYVNKDKLFDAMVDAYNSDNKRKKYSKMSRKFSEKFTWDNCVDKIVKLLDGDINVG